jgi:hypothetical protein
MLLGQEANHSDRSGLVRPASLLVVVSAGCCRAASAARPRGGSTWDGPHCQGEAEPTAPRCVRGHLRCSCHKRTITAVLNGLERTATDNHARPRPAPFSPSQVTAAAERALGARGRLAKALISLAVPASRSGPWSQRTGVPQASATGRDKRPMLTGLPTGPNGVGRLCFLARR